jgi:hypothetical protein
MVACSLHNTGDKQYGHLVWGAGGGGLVTIRMMTGIGGNCGMS